MAIDIGKKASTRPNFRVEKRGRSDGAPKIGVDLQKKGPGPKKKEVDRRLGDVTRDVPDPGCCSKIQRKSMFARLARRLRTLAGMNPGSSTKINNGQSALDIWRQREAQTTQTTQTKPVAQPITPPVTSTEPKTSAPVVNKFTAKSPSTPVQSTALKTSGQLGQQTTPMGARIGILTQPKAKSTDTPSVQPSVQRPSSSELDQIKQTTGTTTTGTVSGLTPTQIQERFTGKDGIYATTITENGYKFEGSDLHISDPSQSDRLGGPKGRRCVSHIRADVPQELMSFNGGTTKAGRYMAVLKDVRVNADNFVDASYLDRSSNQGVSGQTAKQAGKSADTVVDELHANLEQQKAGKHKGNNEIRLFNNDRDGVVGFLWQPKPTSGATFLSNPNNASEFNSTVKNQFQNFVDGMCNGPSDKQGSSQEVYMTNRRDSFPVFKYQEKDGGMELVHVATIKPTPNRTFNPSTAAFSIPARQD